MEGCKSTNNGHSTIHGSATVATSLGAKLLQPGKSSLEGLIGPDFPNALFKKHLCKSSVFN